MSDAGAGRRGGAHVVDAVLDLVADQGMTGLSFRAAAARAGVSPAQVQYYFRSKDELLGAVFDRLSADVELRLAAVDTTGPVRKVLAQLLRVWLPLDESRVRAARVWLAFTAAAATSPLLGPRQAAVDRQVRADLAALLRRARDDGDLGPGLDPGIEATVLLAVVDGLTLQALAVPADERAHLLDAGLNAHLSRLLPGPAVPS